jgi:hypothetical protein
MQPLDQCYHGKIPECQHGAVRKKGTDLATHVILTAFEVASRWAWCIFVLYVDLAKAFDRVVREIVMGIPRSCNLPLSEYLASIGIDRDASRWIADYLKDQGPLLQQWGVPDEVVELICALHDHCWFKYANLDSVVVTKVGARQGCRSGPCIFNAGYAVALGVLHAGMVEAGICIRLKHPSQMFWMGADPLDESVHLIDVTFVDDEAVILMASSAGQLNTAISALLKLITVTFANLDFKINWDKGKTECSVVLRGKGATGLMSKWHHDDGTWHILVPSDDGSMGKLFIVSSYKHLGTIVATDESDVLDAKHKASSAMSAYVPISVKIFGSDVVHFYLKLVFLQSLVLSRLLYNLHIRVPSHKFVAITSNVYMRVLRRISGDMRFNSASFTDLAIRSKLRRPSVDCIAMQKRLLYLPRLVQAGGKSLLALLAVGSPTKPVKWVTTLLSDLRFLKAHSWEYGNMPEPGVDPDVWRSAIIGDCEQWQCEVRGLIFIDSVADTKTEIPLHVRTFGCDLCPGTNKLWFPSVRALATHKRTAHGQLSDIKRYAGGDGVCLACGTSFSTRLRLVAHVSDRRRPKCRDELLENHQPPPLDEVARLDALDWAYQKETRKRGHTQPLSSRQAMKLDGRNVGQIKQF